MMAFAAALLCGCKTSTSTDKIGLQLYSIRDEVSKDLSGSLQKVAEIGYDFIEAAGYDGSKGTFYGLQPEEFSKLCESYGLEFTSSHINGPDPNTTYWADCLAWWDKAIAAHKAAGVSYIVQPSMHKSAYEALYGLRKYCELFNAVGEKCNAAGIKFGYHNHNREFTTDFGGIRVYDYMLQNTDPSKVFFQIDLYWIQVGGASSIKYFEAYPGRFASWHVKDELEIGGSGNMNFKAIYQDRELSGMEYQVIEQEAFSEGLTPFESIKQSYDYLRKLLN